jgi:hypothetical protein
MLLEALLLNYLLRNAISCCEQHRRRNALSEDWARGQLHLVPALTSVRILPIFPAPSERFLLQQVGNNVPSKHLCGGIVVKVLLQAHVKKKRSSPIYLFPTFQIQVNQLRSKESRDVCGLWNKGRNTRFGGASDGSKLDYRLEKRLARDEGMRNSLESNPNSLTWTPSINNIETSRHFLSIQLLQLVS